MESVRWQVYHATVKTQVAGYPKPSIPPDYTPPEAIADFLAGGAPPVYFGLGSMPVTAFKKGPKVRFQEIVHHLSN